VLQVKKIKRYGKYLHSFGVDWQKCVSLLSLLPGKCAANALNKLLLQFYNPLNFETHLQSLFCRHPKNTIAILHLHLSANRLKFNVVYS